MAGTLTHHISAIRVINKLNKSEKWNRGFMFGVHGPDFFFFGNSKLGTMIHSKKPGWLFDNYNKIQSDDFSVGYAYGVMMHYFLDSTVHQYVSYKASITDDLNCHCRLEKDIDYILFEREFNQDVNKFKFSKTYKISNEEIKSITNYWANRCDDPFIEYKNIKKCIKRMIFITNKWIRSSGIVYIFFSLIEKILRRPGEATCHFLKNPDTSSTNDERNSWVSDTGVHYESLDEMLEGSITEFLQEIELISNSKEDYKFNHDLTFGGRK